MTPAVTHTPGHTAAREGRTANFKWTPLPHHGPDGLINGRIAEPFELEVMARYYAAQQAKDAALINTGRQP